MNTKQEAGNEKVTIYDIARQAGVSTTTVHKALHGKRFKVNWIFWALRKFS